MSYEIKVKNGIAFNLDDPFQLEQYKHLCKIPNVSGYMKRLIAMDMSGSWRASSTYEQPGPESVEVDDNLMLNLI